MRMGDLWNESLIDETTKERMHQIVEGKIEAILIASTAVFAALETVG